MWPGAHRRTCAQLTEEMRAVTEAKEAGAEGACGHRGGNQAWGESSSCPELRKRQGAQ